jgi:hypothetical protein
MVGRRFISLVLVLVAAVAVACAPAAVQRGAASGSAPPSQPESSKADYSGGSAVNATSSNDGDRMIVRSAKLSLVVRDTESSAEEIKAATIALGGYVVQTQLYRQNELLRGTIIVRIPSESLDEVISQFKAMAVRVENESSNAQDVTEDYSDLGAQLHNLEATEHELQELLTTVRERTGKAEEILAVYRELTNIRGQIEQLKGRMQYLERTSDLAAVTIELVPDVLAQPIASDRWRPLETVSGALRALLQTLRWLVDALIVLLLYVVPIATLIFVPCYVAWRVLRRWKNRGKA